MISEKRYQILIVDDHQVVSIGLQQIIRQTILKDALIDVAPTGVLAQEQIQKRSYDLFILDLELPDMSGCDLIEIIRTKNTNARIIVHTMHEELWYYRKLEEMHVSGIVYKASDPNHIIDAIKCVLHNGTYRCPHAQHLAQLVQHKNLLLGQDLSKRELSVLKCISQGMSTEEIATHLSISPNTVESHRRHLNAKLDAKNAASLIMNAIAKKILPIH